MTSQDAEADFISSLLLLLLWNVALIFSETTIGYDVVWIFVFGNYSKWNNIDH